MVRGTGDLCSSRSKAALGRISRDGGGGGGSGRVGGFMAAVRGMGAVRTSGLLGRLERLGVAIVLCVWIWVERGEGRGRPFNGRGNAMLM